MFLRERTQGQGLVEYGLIIALVAVVAIAGLIILGPSVSSLFTALGSTGASREGPIEIQVGEMPDAPGPEHGESWMTRHRHWQHTQCHSLDRSQCPAAPRILRLCG